MPTGFCSATSGLTNSWGACKSLAHDYCQGVWNSFCSEVSYQQDFVVQVQVSRYVQVFVTAKTVLNYCLEHRIVRNTCAWENTLAISQQRKCQPIDTRLGVVLRVGKAMGALANKTECFRRTSGCFSYKECIHTHMLGPEAFKDRDGACECDLSSVIQKAGLAMANSHALLALLCAALWSLGLAAPQFKDDTCSVIEENLCLGKQMSATLMLESNMLWHKHKLLNPRNDNTKCIKMLDLFSFPRSCHHPDTRAEHGTNC